MKWNLFLHEKSYHLEDCDSVFKDREVQMAGFGYPFYKARDKIETDSYRADCEGSDDIEIDEYYDDQEFE